MNSISSTATPELVVLLDEDGHATGTAAKTEVHGKETPLHLAFSCYVFNPEGRLLVTRRALHKRTWPGVWSNSCCGHPAPDEPQEAAVHRRVREELGIELRDVRVCLPDFRYRAVDATGTVENELCPVYTALATEHPVPEETEIVDWAWADWPEFVRLAERAPWAISPWAAEQAPLVAARLDSDRNR
ncbi:isopentenyl-diphosphate Delta-isomerase [Haloactinomyces albus]|uniref:Isopentenyl-diphosphate Delta-isomerase n=1 Tax=Haloactinomyces albus TaxID=1352928 RepID=A0AAE4CJR0_9ACTN|nr:isopentenyl-diphosphate Delta-isomerase [Haloactinomyces albus]MDR7299964.1 isopentenyl-diphosphate delta-isomerase [Haloactinomyces albus]